MARSTSQLRRLWGPACDRPLSTLSTPSGARISVDRRAAEAFRALLAIMARYNYTLKPSSTGAYNCRKITGGRGYSLHAYGIAADFNWNDNPYSSRYVTDMPMAMVLEILALRTNGGHRVFRWGGDWDYNPSTRHSKYDTMHYEIVASPHELSLGITTRKETENMTIYLHKGEEGSHIVALQEALNAFIMATGGGQSLLLGLDGTWGDKTSDTLHHCIARMQDHKWHQLGDSPRVGVSLAKDGKDKFNVMNIAPLWAVIAERELPKEVVDA